MGWLRALVSLASALINWLRQRQLLEAGKASQRAQDLEKNSEIKDEQIKAEQDRPRDATDLADRLRKPGGGL